VTVSQLPNAAKPFDTAWSALAAHVAEEGSDLVVLPEMPFAPWLAARREVDPSAWARAVEAHEHWCGRLHELGAAAAVGSRPVSAPDRHNRAFAWRRGGGLEDLHDKAFLPDEEGFWEATWYRRGAPNFRTTKFAAPEGGQADLGVLLCTEMWFLEHARAYGRAGAHIVAVPRATPASTLDKWIAGGRTTAVVSGAFCVSSVPYNAPGQGADLGGGAWIIDPEGELLALTSAAHPFVTWDLDLELAAAAKRGYPRYVAEYALPDNENLDTP
jgi:N-carbamoylputrescine amidase